jgi:predicted Fe-S protein YdhL (DUF1289 family)
MRTPTRIIIVCLAVSLIGAFATLASSPYITSQTASPLDYEEEALRQQLALSTTSKEADHIWSGLDRIEEDRRALQSWEVMSPSERQDIIDVMRHEAQQAMKVSPDQENTSAENMPRPFLGIFNGEEVPAPFHGSEFRVVNYWGGDFDGQPVSAYAGYRPDNPKQGVLALAIGKGVHRYVFFAVPTSSGPLRITNVVDGEIRLVSVGGAFTEESIGGEKASVSVRVEGGKEYTFDLQSLRFK